MYIAFHSTTSLSRSLICATSDPWLELSVVPNLLQPFIWIWKTKIVMKEKIFAWILLSHQLNTRNVLKPRSYNIACRVCDSSNILSSTAILALLKGHASTSLSVRIGIGLIWFLLLKWASMRILLLCLVFTIVALNIWKEIRIFYFKVCCQLELHYWNTPRQIFCSKV